MKMLSLLVLGLGATALVGCGTYASRNAAIGAATGAAIGGVVGHQSGETEEGAALGAAIGGVAGAAHGSSVDRRADTSRRGVYTSDDYLRLMTPDEVATLQARARASGQSNYQLTDFLTDAERENLRRRDRDERLREIGT